MKKVNVLLFQLSFVIPTVNVPVVFWSIFKNHLTHLGHAFLRFLYFVDNKVYNGWVSFYKSYPKISQGYKVTRKKKCLVRQQLCWSQHHNRLLCVMFVSAVESFDAYCGDQRMKKRDKKRWIIKKVSRTICFL